MSLNNLSKKELIEKVTLLQIENAVLKELQAFMKLIEQKENLIEKTIIKDFKFEIPD